MSQISYDDIKKYAVDGFFVVRNLLNEATVAYYRQAIDEQIQQQQVRLQSPTGYDKVFIQVHQVWQKNEILKKLSMNHDLARIAAQLSGMNEIRVFLDQIIFKQPGADATRTHQDAAYLSFSDERSINCWIAFDDTTTENGALVYYVGSHKLGRLRIVHLDQNDDITQDVPAINSFSTRLVQAKAGDAIFHNCHILHYAYANRSSSPRRAYSIQYMPNAAYYNGWLHHFLEIYQPKLGQLLDFECFPIVEYNV